MTELPLVLAANPIEWILNHVPQVLFILFFLGPTLAQVFKKKREAKQEKKAEEEAQYHPPVPAGPTQARVPTPAAPDEDLEQRVRRYFEQITGHREPEPKPEPEPEPAPRPDPEPLRRAQQALATHKDPEPETGPSNAQRVHSVFAPIPQTFVQGEVDFDAHVHHGDVAPQVEVTRRFAGASVSTRLLDLHDPWALRRAVVLREVLGPPLALRDHTDA